MNGPEHFEQAEKRLRDQHVSRTSATCALAHATLALAAATVDAAYGDLSIPAGEAWDAVLGAAPLAAVDRTRPDRVFTVELGSEEVS